MTRQELLSAHSNPQAQVLSNQPGPSSEDDRPLAEVRRTVQDVMRMVSLHRWAFLIPCCLVASAAFILSLYYPRTYRAVCSFERRNDPILVNLPNVSGSAAFPYFRSTMVRDLTSVPYMSEVVDNLGLTKDFDRDEDGNLTPASKRRRTSLARSLAGTIRLDTEAPNKHVDVIWIRYTGSDPVIGTRLLDEVKKTYVKRTMAWIREFLEKQRSYYADEARVALQGVKLAERDLTNLRLEMPFADPTSPGSIATQTSQYELARSELLMRQREYRTELTAMEQRFAVVDQRLHSSVDQETETFQQIARIQRVDNDIAKLRKSRGMTPEHPEIRQLNADRARLVAQLERLRDTRGETAVTNSPLVSPAVIAAVNAASPAQQPLRTEYAQLRIQIGAQNSKIKEVEINLSSKDRALAQLARARENIHQRQEEYEDIVANVNKAKRRHNEVLMTLETIEPAIRAVQQDRLLQFTAGTPARGSSTPVNPQARTIILLAVLAGVGAGAVFVILAELLDHMYHNSGQVARSLGLPILESIDEIVTSVDRRRRFIRKAVLVPIALSCILGLVAVTGSLAYLSITKPWTYQRIKEIPRNAFDLIAGTDGKGDSTLPSAT